MDVKKTQKRLLEMAKDIAKILEKNNVRYFLTLGTLLGAVRHKGFIPWDDDFDFHIIDEDYDKALKCLKKELPNNLFLEYFDSEPLYFHAWAHVKDLYSEAECSEFPQDNVYKHKGISIDLYKIEHIKRKDVDKYINDEYMNYINRRKDLGLMTDEEYKTRILREKNKSTDKDVKSNDYVYAFVSVYKRKYLLEDDIFPLKKYKYEDTEFYGPNKAEKILTDIYGDYMKLPPIEKRKSHYSKVKFIKDNIISEGGKNMKEVIGYTAGVYDLFHMGHLNLLKNAKGMCDKLIVGVTVDELVKYKGKEAFIPFTERAEIVRSCRYVDSVVPQENMDKITMCKKLGATYLFVGDDWYGTDKWKDYEKEAKKAGISIIYFPYTKSISSTKIREALKQGRGWTRTEDGKNIEEKEGTSIVDKDYCCSSYLALRYVEKDNTEFFENMCHRTYELPKKEECTPIGSEKELDKELKRIFKKISDKKLGILLSGGMDSACLASYMPKGSDAYTFRFLKGKYDPEELHRAEDFAKEKKLNLHYVDIDFDIIKECLNPVMESKGAPVHSIEPQLYKAALQAKEDGVELLVIGDAADYVFYGMDGLLSKDWNFEDFYKRAIYIEPSEVLKNPKDMKYLFERYRKDNNMIDFIGFYDKSITEESYASYDNAFKAAQIDFIDPYEYMKLKESVDLSRIRNGDSKYYIRSLFRMKYPNIPLPEKHPMPRPVDKYFKDWEGPKRKEFKRNIDMSKYSGNQKWLLWCLEQFLNKYDK